MIYRSIIIAIKHQLRNEFWVVDTNDSSTRKENTRSDRLEEKYKHLKQEEA